jgi:hypothetical protein
MTAGHVIWLVLVVYLLAGVFFFVSRRKTSLPVGTLLLPALGALALRTAAWLAWRTFDGWDVVGLIAVSLLAVAALVGRRAWLVRSTPDDLTEQLDSACASIRLRTERRSSGELVLLRKEGADRVPTYSLGSGLQLLMLPKTASAKGALLVDVLRKRYPRCWPRFSISLSRSKE